MNRILSLLLLMFLSLSSMANDNKELGIVPQPRKVKIIDRTHQFTIDAKTTLVYEKEAQKSASYLLNRFNTATGWELERAGNKADNCIVLAIEKSLSNNKDTYTLVSDENKVVITGASEQGLFYGVQTLLQLLPTEIYSQTTRFDVNWKLPSVEIEDQPAFTRYRGMLIDISRHFRTKEELKQTIDIMAMHKMNTLHFHFADEDGWRVESKIYPKLNTIGSIGDRSNVGKGRSYMLTQNEVKELIAYANERFIKILPEIDMPGHMQAVIRSYPELGSASDLRETKKVIRIDEKGAEFCRNVLREYAELFDSEEMHLGFDEVNLGSKTTIYTDEEIINFAKSMTQFVKDELKLTPILWDDAFEKGLHDKDCIAQWWRYGKVHWWSEMEMTIDEKAQKYDQPYIMSPANYTYFDMRNVEKSIDKNAVGAGWADEISVAQIYAWDPFLDLVNYDESKRHLAQGIICAVWGEGVKTYEIFETLVYPRLATMSEKCWAHTFTDFEKMPWEDYRDHVLMKQLKRYDELGIKYWSKGDLELLRSIKAEKK
ncbi:MAG: beta-N-acetylhexosaminidase [Bacteroidales bacterium]|nr:beta-N-acetylhexosaminidase [Bacteroidales bacterium]